MAGLVASGAVMALCVAANWLLGRFVRGYRPPRWPRVWAACAVPLTVGLPLITMTANAPVLPAANAALVTLVTLAGLALALLPGEMAAARPLRLVLLASDGFGLALILLYLVSLDLVGRWLANGALWYVQMLVVALVLGVAWLLVMSAVRVWRRTTIPGAAALFASALCIAYLLMPLVHHTLVTDGYYYISDSDNFFARSGLLQAATWAAAALLALAITRLRHYLAARPRGPKRRTLSRTQGINVI
ncbi:MAG: hypothetical protein M5R40_03615 [Anaerolineae bacterium]|nr:hypothetical protein [Anaerolineae bacterium]